MHKTAKMVNKETSMGGDLISWDQTKTFDMVDHRYLTVVSRVARFGLVFRGWITTTYKI